MNHRWLVLGVLLGALALTAGCVGQGGLDQSALAQNATYDWQTNANATVNITGSNYHAVYVVHRNQSLEVYRRDQLDSEYPVDVSAIKFQYPNGTVVGVERLTVTKEGDRTVIAPPADGKVAYTASTRPKEFGTPVLVDGSHEVILPANMRIALPLFGTVSPDGYTLSQGADGRVHIRWDETPSGPVSLRYYLARDFYLFTGLVVALVVLGAGGVVYYRLRIRELERRRKRAGLDLEK